MEATASKGKGSSSSSSNNAMPSAKAPTPLAASAPPQQPTSTYSFQQRFMQKLALTCIMLNIIGPFWYWPLTLIVLYYNPLHVGRGVMAAYLLYIFLVDKDAHLKPEGNTSLRRLKFWRHIANYFPAQLIKTADLDPKLNYLICGHPHGIACFSYVANFFIEGTGFSDIYPGITLYPALLDQHFWTPIHREVALCSGFRGNSKQAFLNLLQGPPGTSMFLVPGGAPEALRSSPGTYDLIIKKRKGFVKLALQTGAQLVPVIAFGETDLFEVTQPKPGSLMEKVQALVLQVTKFALPSISGAGFYNGSGLLPRSRPLTTVIGAPVAVVKWQGPTEGDKFRAAVDELHARYCEALKELWNTHKDKYAVGRRKSLEIVD